jgi:GH25 family lysozyme M1 (1,4-beta-N-acetylmuramidase)
MQRLMGTILAIGLVVFLFVTPATTEAKPRPKPSPTPIASPTPTPTPQPSPTSTPQPLPTVTPTPAAPATPSPPPTLTPSPVPTATPSPAPAQYVNGIDVSYHQGTIDWSRVAGSGTRFAFLRASAGTLTADSAYAAYRSGARNAGLTVGSYHFANPDGAANDAQNEAAWFLRNATVSSGDLVPVLDLEVANGLSAASLTAWAQTWLAQVTAATGVRPIIYTNNAFWSGSMANTDWFARNGYALWIAHWTAASQPTVPAAGWGGTGWRLWQHSSTGTVPGIAGAVDLDRFNGPSLPASILVP